jgi:K+-sensing histidine kinase KdpD
MRMPFERHPRLNSILVVTLAGGLAYGLCLWLRDFTSRPVAPAILLLVIIFIANVFDRLSTLLAAIAGGLVFAVVLFPPYGSVAVREAADRLVLVLFDACAVGVAYLSPVRKH